MIDEQLRTATHEAGHAVVARKLGLLCGEATIIPDYEAGTAGCAIIKDPHESLNAWENKGKFRSIRSVYRARVLALMAGVEAEAEILGSAAVGDGDDRCWITFVLDDIGLSSERDELRFRRTARRLVRRYRPEIEGVASALAVRGQLAGAKLDAMVPVYEPQREPPFWMLSAEPGKA